MLCRTAGFPIYIFIVQFFVYHTVDKSPIGQSAHITVVNKEVGFQLTGEVLMVLVLFRIVTVDGIELQPPVATKTHSLFQQFALANAPQNEPVALLGKALQRFNGKRYFVTYSRIAMLDDSSVKIDSNNTPIYL